MVSVVGLVMRTSKENLDQDVNIRRTFEVGGSPSAPTQTEGGHERPQEGRRGSLSSRLVLGSGRVQWGSHHRRWDRRAHHDLEPGRREDVWLHEEEIVGRPVLLLTPESHAQQTRAIIAQISAGQPVEHLETFRVRKDGSVFWSPRIEWTKYLPSS